MILLYTPSRRTYHLTRLRSWQKPHLWASGHTDAMRAQIPRCRTLALSRAEERNIPWSPDQSKSLQFPLGQANQEHDHCRRELSESSTTRLVRAGRPRKEIKSRKSVQAPAARETEREGQGFLINPSRSKRTGVARQHRTCWKNARTR